jgi:uncharacterized protein DUF4124
MIKGLVAAVLLLFCPIAGAEFIYKYQRADGTIAYSDKPLPGARLLGRFQLVPLPAEDARSSNAASGDESARQAEERARRRVEALDAVDTEIRLAAQALTDAKERQKAGVDPLPGERVGNAGARTSRLRTEYFERQRQLSDEVAQAQARLDRAYRIRNELRE